jgi:hypothetical protein
MHQWGPFYQMTTRATFGRQDSPRRRHIAAGKAASLKFSNGHDCLALSQGNTAWQEALQRAAQQEALQEAL